MILDGQKSILTDDKDDIRYWIALNLIEDIGPVIAKKLLSVFHSPKKIFEARLNKLKEIEAIKDTRAKKIYEFDSWDRVDKEIKAVNYKNIRIIRYIDKEYPDELRQFNDSPIILYIKGAFLREDRYSIAIVGSRKMTDYGKKIAHTLSFELASMGITIISGMARGIDSIAHKGALEASGRSIAVLGCGLDKPYPPENEKLLNALSSQGCVVSEFCIGTPPVKENFPKRNRLISGLSLGVILVEAAKNSGSLITANYAIEQNKEVFAVPGNITSKNSEGTNWFIKKGAKLVQNTQDVIEEIAPLLKGLLNKKTSTLGEGLIVDIEKLEISDEEKAICNLLKNEPKHIDLISRQLSVSSPRILETLLNLEIKGIVKHGEGKIFSLI